MRLALIFCALLAACNFLPSTPLPKPIQATTVYINGGTLGTASLPDYLRANLPAIKDTGFNAVYLPAVWRDFDPTPLSGAGYNAAAFANARAALDVVRAAGMRTVVGLNYVGVGYAPDFGAVLPQDKACDWARTPQVYAAFERYAARVMTEFAAYHDMLRLMVFTEGAEGCGLATPEAAAGVAAQLQTTLGSLPTRMPPLQRVLWSWGYHDYSIINLGWGDGASPIATPNPFDWVSMVTYNVSDTAELDRRAARFKALYPTKPLYVGEAGANGCPGASPSQQMVDGNIVIWAQAKDYGFNIWGWPNAGAAECTNPVYGGYALTNQDGTPNDTARALKELMKSPSP